MTNLTEKLHGAVRILVRHEPIKQRLDQAYSTKLDGIGAEQVPEPLRDQWRQLAERMHRYPPCGSESSVQATVRKMSNAEADDCAEAMLLLLLRLTQSGSESARSGRRGRDVLTVVDGEQEWPEAPAFLLGGGTRN